MILLVGIGTFFIDRFLGSDMDVHEPDADRSVDELLDWLCWRMAHRGMDFYPPEDRLEQAVDALDLDDETGRAEEKGAIIEKWLTADDFFADLDNLGFDPVGRAEREAARLDDRTDRDYDPTIDWSFCRIVDDED